jgi:hypothetical protein
MSELKNSDELTNEQLNILTSQKQIRLLLKEKNSLLSRLEIIKNKFLPEIEKLTSDGEFETLAVRETLFKNFKHDLSKEIDLIDIEIAKSSSSNSSSEDDARSHSSKDSVRSVPNTVVTAANTEVVVVSESKKTSDLLPKIPVKLNFEYPNGIDLRNTKSLEGDIAFIQQLLDSYFPDTTHYVRCFMSLLNREQFQHLQAFKTLPWDKFTRHVVEAYMEPNVQRRNISLWKKLMFHPQHETVEQFFLEDHQKFRIAYPKEDYEKFPDIVDIFMSKLHKDLRDVVYNEIKRLQQLEVTATSSTSSSSKLLQIIHDADQKHGSAFAPSFKTHYDDTKTLAHVISALQSIFAIKRNSAKYSCPQQQPDRCFHHRTARTCTARSLQGSSSTDKHKHFFGYEKDDYDSDRSDRSESVRSNRSVTFSDNKSRSQTNKNSGRGHASRGRGRDRSSNDRTSFSQQKPSAAWGDRPCFYKYKTTAGSLVEHNGNHLNKECRSRASKSTSVSTLDEVKSEVLPSNPADVSSQVKRMDLGSNSKVPVTPASRPPTSQIQAPPFVPQHARDPKSASPRSSSAGKIDSSKPYENTRQKTSGKSRKVSSIAQVFSDQSLTDMSSVLPMHLVDDMSSSDLNVSMSCSRNTFNVTEESPQGKPTDHTVKNKVRVISHATVPIGTLKPCLKAPIGIDAADLFPTVLDDVSYATVVKNGAVAASKRLCSIRSDRSVKVLDYPSPISPVANQQRKVPTGPANPVEVPAPASSYKGEKKAVAPLFSDRATRLLKSRSSLKSLFDQFLNSEELDPIYSRYTQTSIDKIGIFSNQLVECVKKHTQLLREEFGPSSRMGRTPLKLAPQLLDSSGSDSDADVSKSHRSAVHSQPSTSKKCQPQAPLLNRIQPKKVKNLQEDFSESKLDLDTILAERLQLGSATKAAMQRPMVLPTHNRFDLLSDPVSDDDCFHSPVQTTSSTRKSAFSHSRSGVLRDSRPPNVPAVPVKQENDFYGSPVPSRSFSPNRKRDNSFAEKYSFIKFLGLLSHKLTHIRTYFMSNSARLSHLHDELISLHSILEHKYESQMDWVHNNFGHGYDSDLDFSVTSPPTTPPLHVLLHDSLSQKRDNFAFVYALKLFNRRLISSYKNGGALPDGRFPHQLEKTHPLFVKLPNHLRKFLRRDYPLSKQLMPKFLHHMSLMEVSESKLFLRFFEHATKRAAAKKYCRLNYPAFKISSMHKVLYCDTDGERNYALPQNGDQVPPQIVFQLAAENLFSANFRKEFLDHPFIAVRASFLANSFKRAADERLMRAYRMRNARATQNTNSMSTLHTPVIESGDETVPVVPPAVMAKTYKICAN